MMDIRTLGKFTVTIGDRTISDDFTRSNRVWKIFKYLITNRHKTATVETLIEILWPESGPEHPEKTLYTLISRLRKLLNAPSESGGQYILYHHDSYGWNSNIAIFLDVAEFESQIKHAGGVGDDKAKLPYLKLAADIYDGDYLGESAYEMWILPVTNYYRRLYMRCVTELSDIYSRMGAQDEIIELCGKVISIYPYEESAYVRLIQALYINGEENEAQRHYRRYCELVKKEFGAQPSEEFQAMMKSMKNASDSETDIVGIKRILDGELAKNNAYFCSVDNFAHIYQLDKRADERMKFPVFLALVTMMIENDDAGDGKALKTAMVAMRQCLMRTLRRGDVISQFSKNQFLLMLSARLLNDAEMAMKRIQRLFGGEYTGKPCAISVDISQVGN